MRRSALRLLLGLSATALFFVLVQVVRPEPTQAVAIETGVKATAGPGLPWPASREAAVTIGGLGGIRAYSRQVPVPIASLAKIMTAYVVLRDHPLISGAAGPAIVITRAQAAAYRPDLAASESVVKVQAGESLTERQALEALLLPSADNAADILAQWDAGGIRAFVARMNAQARSFGMSQTHYTDPSGLAPATVSTARDQLILVRKAMAIPAFASIVAMPAAKLPVAGTVENFDYDVGHNGVIGVKTGSDAAALGCWAFAALRSVDGTTRVVYGDVLGVPATRQGLVEPALAAGVAIASAVPKTVRPTTVLPAGSTVGQLTAPWRKDPVPIVTSRALTGLAVSGTPIKLRFDLRRLTSDAVRRGEQIGMLSASGIIGTNSTGLLIARSAAGPSMTWRLSRL
jgi:serine-type D-Ala-D-Ala carboxypeptidase (penicillin-binding protein 5/6)